MSWVKSPFQVKLDGDWIAEDRTIVKSAGMNLEEDLMILIFNHFRLPGYRLR